MPPYEDSNEGYEARKKSFLFYAPAKVFSQLTLLWFYAPPKPILISNKQQFLVDGRIYVINLDPLSTFGMIPLFSAYYFCFSDAAKLAQMSL